MLAVGVELDGVVVAVRIRVLHAGLERPGKTEVHRQRDQMIASLAADGGGSILRAVVHNDVIDVGRVLPQILDRRYDVLLFVIRRYNGEHSFVHNLPT